MKLSSNKKGRIYTCAFDICMIWTKICHHSKIERLMTQWLIGWLIAFVRHNYGFVVVCPQPIYHTVVVVERFCFCFGYNFRRNVVFITIYLSARQWIVQTHRTPVISFGELMENHHSWVLRVCCAGLLITPRLLSWLYLSLVITAVVIASKVIEVFWSIFGIDSCIKRK